MTVRNLNTSDTIDRGFAIIGLEVVPVDDMPLRIKANCQGDLNADYELAVQRWLLTTDAQEAKHIYVSDVFPLSCERIAEAASKKEILDLLFVPVGTQPFAPTLSIIGNPARCVALLETDQSYNFGKQVAQSFPDTPETTFLHVRISDTDVVDIAEKMKSVFDTRGLPSGAHVGADLTGGRKTMTAAIAGVGSLFAWRLFYVESKFERTHSAFGHHERVLELSNVLDVFGSRRRETIINLIESGAAESAIEQLSLIIQESAASKPDRELLEFAQAFSALRQGKFSLLKHSLGRLPEVLSSSIDRRTVDVMKIACGKTTGAKSAQAAVLIIAAESRLTHGDTLAASALLRQAGRMFRLPANELEAATPKVIIRKLSKQPRVKEHLDSLDSLKNLFIYELPAHLRNFR